MSQTARILVVDDDAHLLRATSRLLKKAGYEVSAARTGAEGLRLAKARKPDLILLDVMLPDVDGVEVCRRIKGEPALNGCFVIVLSSTKTSPDDQAGGLEAGADGYIARPISNRELLARVTAFLRIKRAEGRVEHLNQVLHAIRNVNQLIVRERDRDRLLQGACDNLIATRGYHNAWIALLDECGGLVTSAEAGLGTEFAPLREQLKRGALVACGQRALAQSTVVVSEDPCSTCADCPLATNYAGRGGMTVRLEHGSQIYGLLCASLPTHLVTDAEEQALFHEVAEDIAFALHDIELEEQRERAQEALARQEAELRATLYGIGDAVIATDIEGRVARMNPVAEQLTGWTEAEAAGQPLEAVFYIVNEETGRRVENPATRVLQEGAVVGLANHTLLISKDGREIPIADSCAPILDPQGDVTGAVLVFRDQTEERLAQRLIEIRLSLIEYAASHTLDELLTRALDEVGAFVNSPIGFYHFVESDQKTLSLQQWSTRTRREFCQAEGEGMHYSIDQAGVWVDCVRQRKPVIHNDYASLPHKKGMPEGHAEVIRELVVPVMREDRIVAILGVGNKPTGYTQKDVEIVSYLADVTWEIVRQKRAEEALRESKSLLDATGRTARVGGWELDAENQDVRWTEETYRIHEVPLDYDPPLQEAIDFFHPADQERLSQALQKALDEGEPYDMELRLITAKGKHLWTRTICHPQIVDGKTVKLVGTIQDITERKRAEERAEEEQNRLASIVEYSDDAIIGLSPDGRVLTWNRGAERLFGRSNEEAKGKPIATLIALDRPEQLSDSLAKVQQGAPAAHLYALPLMKDDHVVYVSMTVSPVKGADGRVIGASLIGRDVTDPVRAQEAREREMRTWEGLSGPVQAAGTAEAFGLSPLSKSQPQAFAELVERYEQALEHSWETKAYRVQHPISGELRTIAEHLGRARARPRDVVQIHITALKNKGRGIPLPKAQAYAEEGRLLIVELMGYLTSYYRKHSLGANQRRVAGDAGKENAHG